MASPGFNPIREISDSAKDYAQLKRDEYKLKAVKRLSTLMSSFFTILLLFLLLLMAVFMLLTAAGEFLGGLFGSPIWGLLIVAGLILIFVGIIVVSNKKFFIDKMVRLFIEAFFDSDDNE
ncbi:MAG: hypothetical protein HUJ90_03500 [Bacteroidales bacterium]|nr:hypothetical protein [Bacteroidales bacterium]